MGKNLTSVKYWAAEIKHNKETDEYFLEFPEMLLEQLGWKENDDLIWKILPDGKFLLIKQNDYDDEQYEDVGC